MRSYPKKIDPVKEKLVEERTEINQNVVTPKTPPGGQRPGGKSKMFVIAVVGLSLLMTALTGGCAPGVISNLEGDNEPNASEQVLGTIDINTSTPTNTPEPTFTLTPTQTATLRPTETPEPTSTPTRISTSEDYWVRGYSLGITRCGGVESWCTTLVVESSTIDNYYIDGDEIVLEVEMLIYERKIKEEIKANSFEFLVYDGNTRSFSKPEIFTTKNFSELSSWLNNTGPKIRYQLRFTVDGYPDFSDDLVVDYVSDYVDLDFKLIEIVQYETTRW